jgi:hypothetical protein
MWQAVNPSSDRIVKIPGQALLVHVGKGSTHETAALLGRSKIASDYEVSHNSVARTDAKRSPNTLRSFSCVATKPDQNDISP